MSREIPKVVHISTVHPPLDTRIYYKECLSLAEEGFNTTLIISEHKDTEQINRELINVIEIKKVKNRFFRILKSNLEAFKVAKKLNADIYHLHDPELLLIGRLIKNKSNTVIFDVHEDYETSIRQKKYLKKPFNILFSKIYNFIEKILIKKLELCFAEKYYKEKYNRGIQILNYPLIKNLDIKQQSFSSNKSEVNLLYTGAISSDRGAYIHAELPNMDKNIKVKLVGICSNDTANQMYEITNDKSRLIIKGVNEFIPRNEIDDEYKKGHWLAGLALFPPTDHYMKKELTKFFEYMNVGIPIICSNFPHWIEFIEKYQCGITVDPFNEKEIIDAIHYLRDNPQKALQMGENGKMAVQNELNWNKEKEKLIDWYNNLIRKRNTVGGISK